MVQKKESDQSHLERCEERNASNSVIKRYYKTGVEDTANGSAKYLYVRDQLGSIREITDSTGALQARYNYSPYGEVAVISGSFSSDFRYTGHFYHERSGLHLAPFRAYDADTGRWLSRDPILENGGINLYAYCLNNPLNCVDPLGFQGFWGQVWNNIGFGGRASGGAGGLGGYIGVDFNSSGISISGGIGIGTGLGASGGISTEVDNGCNKGTGFGWTVSGSGGKNVGAGGSVTAETESPLPALMSGDIMGAVEAMFDFTGGASGGANFGAGWGAGGSISYGGTVQIIQF